MNYNYKCVIRLIVKNTDINLKADTDNRFIVLCSFFFSLFCFGLSNLQSFIHRFSTKEVL